MSLATKNNALILKGGSLARNCACCGSVPQEIQIVLSSGNVSICYACIEVTGFAIYPCAKLDAFSVNGTYTLERTTNLPGDPANIQRYVHLSCLGRTLTRIELSLNIEDCSYLFKADITKGIAWEAPFPPTSPQCRGCSNLIEYSASITFTGTGVVGGAGTSCSGSASSSSSGLVGFDGAKQCREFSVFPWEFCFDDCQRGIANPAKTCTEKTLSVTHVITVS